MAKKAKKKFKVRLFKLYLDELAKLAIKTRASFACEVRHDGCAGQMVPLDFNCQWIHVHSRSSNIVRWDMWNTLCSCGSCHAWAHAHPTEFGKWYEAKYDIRDKHCLTMLAVTPYTWREVAFRAEEDDLLDYLVSINADYLHVSKQYRDRVHKAMERKRLQGESK